MFNRGFRRDDHNNSFRSNTNMSRGHNAPSLMSVSPWEGGVVPGQGGSSILGNPQMQGNQNLLTPQAQVLAQNLNILSNLGLLQPQIQSRQPQSLPSLINLGSALNRSMGMSQQHSNFRQMNQQPNRGMVNNRFQDQRMKYGRQDGRRSEPFNKNRPRPSQSQTSQQKLQSYRPLNSKVSPLQAARKPTTQGADALAKARADVRGNRGAKVDSVKPEAADVSQDDKKAEGDEIVKRDWKKEKKSDVIVIEEDEGKEKAATVPVEEGAEVKPNGDAVDLKAENKVVTAEGEEKQESGVESKEKTVEKSAKGATIYSCHVCIKTMPDEASLNAHLRTQVHKRMMDELEDTYAHKVKRIRDQVRINEEQKEQDLNARGRGRRANNFPRGHCKMCDLTFLGNITAHRKTPLHLKLKTFLHPNCVPCGKEFPARMEWDMHKLTVEHLTVVSGIDKMVRKAGANANRSEPNYARLVPKFPEGLDSVPANMVDENADKVAVEGGTGTDTMKYDPTVVAGVNMLVHGQHCGVCNKFFARRPDALEHCKTRTHFDNYLAMKTKLKEAAEESARVEAEVKAKAASEAEAKAAAVLIDTSDAVPASAESETTQSAEVPIPLEDLKTPVLCLKRAVPRSEEGNWKRSRSATNEEDEDDEEEERELLKSPEVPDEELANKVVNNSETL